MSVSELPVDMVVNYMMKEAPEYNKGAFRAFRRKVHKVFIAKGIDIEKEEAGMGTAEDNPDLCAILDKNPWIVKNTTECVETVDVESLRVIIQDDKVHYTFRFVEMIISGVVDTYLAAKNDTAMSLYERHLRCVFLNAELRANKASWTSAIHQDKYITRIQVQLVSFAFYTAGEVAADEMAIDREGVTPKVSPILKPTDSKDEIDLLKPSNTPTDTATPPGDVVPLNVVDPIPPAAETTAADTCDPTKKPEVGEANSTKGAKRGGKAKGARNRQTSASEDDEPVEYEVIPDFEVRISALWKRDMSVEVMMDWMVLRRFARKKFAEQGWQNASTMHIHERIDIFCKFLEQVFGENETFDAKDVDSFERALSLTFGNILPLDETMPLLMAIAKKHLFPDGT
jgi:hypothetical protein